MKARLLFAKKYVFSHFLISISVATITACFVFFVLYPDPTYKILGTSGIFWLIIVVDIVCGPLLTLVLATPTKPRKELIMDLSLVACIQLTALGYGLYTTYLARPVALVFEVDRFVLVTANEVIKEDIQNAPPKYQSISSVGYVSVSLREPKNGDEQLESVEYYTNGAPTNQRPNWWIPYDKNISKKASKPIASLLKKYDTSPKVLDQIKTELEKHPSISRCLPYTTSRNLDWIVLLDSDMQVKAYLPIDGFGIK